MDVKISGDVSNSGDGSINFSETVTDIDNKAEDQDINLDVDKSSQFNQTAAQDLIKKAEKAVAVGDKATLDSVISSGFAFSKEFGRYLVGRFASESGE